MSLIWYSRLFASVFCYVLVFVCCDVRSRPFVSVLYCVLVFNCCNAYFIKFSLLWCSCWFAAMLYCIPVFIYSPSCFVVPWFLSAVVCVVVCLPLCFVLSRFLFAVMCTSSSSIYCDMVVDLLPYFIMSWSSFAVASVFGCVPVFVYYSTRFTRSLSVVASVVHWVWSNLV